MKYLDNQDRSTNVPESQLLILGKPFIAFLKFSKNRFLQSFLFQSLFQQTSNISRSNIEQ
jgi:hypothetical protein